MIKVITIIAIAIATYFVISSSETVESTSTLNNEGKSLSKTTERGKIQENKKIEEKEKIKSNFRNEENSKTIIIEKPSRVLFATDITRTANKEKKFPTELSPLSKEFGIKSFITEDFEDFLTADLESHEALALTESIETLSESFGKDNGIRFDYAKCSENICQIEIKTKISDARFSEILTELVTAELPKLGYLPVISMSIPPGKVLENFYKNDTGYFMLKVVTKSETKKEGSR